jgi:phospholipid/cholesterol/gamma-HCH transport system permease protein
VVLTPAIDKGLIGLYGGARFLRRFFSEALWPPLHGRELIAQCFLIGVRSLSLITVTGFVIGVVFTKQSRPSLASFGATSWLPSLVTIAIIRGLAPLVTALISAGKVGSSIGAELASMKVTEQLDAMEVSAINPFKFVVVTRILATTLMMPLLTLYCGAIALSGAFLNIYINEGTNPSVFLKNGFDTISFLDLSSTLVRATIYGFTIGAVACYKGIHAGSGTQGVGRAANAAVVVSMLVIFFEEVLSTQVISFLRTL